ncbi:potassium channel family protein [Metabacillus litoralis]|uniref:potassium channel family protein n=1 Tax=Metabacillus litoralis TaxID=152268 RepID=UPI001CFCD80F|nr:potassium channel family protein [Metabacillus litoralis]
MQLVFCIGIVICIFMSFKSVIIVCFQKNFLSFETVVMITYLYLSLLVGFGMIFLICLQNDLHVLVEAGEPISGNYFDKLGTSFYFSAVTLFSVGYGDIVPVGLGRLIAVTEALIGYILPAVFVARTVIGIDKQ